MEFDLGQLRELLKILNETDIEELNLKSDDFELNVRKGVASAGVPPLSPEQLTDLPAATPAVPAPVPVTPAPATEKNWVEVTSPMVGTFYRSPAPEEPPFVEIGDKVRNGQTLCIIEAMKLMNEIEAEISGEIVEILVENAQPVAFGDPLLRIKPSA
ncbi:acetyl-CoA carboxylase biotin carboxyl carrier protein [Lyngbya confervoides]|uniref:Biotin carboxyl carrier protein of acetyl-CoA carboxylase n=1 Tax=Lyngbya confervoides BDU141951 TaxID=1574623 RepID=A0ABD4SY91_9CYAN|nr:acetyl-CoA carboxylase biotin carboxyl carrier protein [Lyngbya confervoides]MCM1981304.1 acetyl-CoA carboxylase biotin carboxyl carrier protein [Lyngbya confervoides BDU141951]